MLVDVCFVCKDVCYRKRAIFRIKWPPTFKKKLFGKPSAPLTVRQGLDRVFLGDPPGLRLVVALSRQMPDTGLKWRLLLLDEHQPPRGRGPRTHRGQFSVPQMPLLS